MMRSTASSQARNDAVNRVENGTVQGAVSTMLPDACSADVDVRGHQHRVDAGGLRAFNQCADSIGDGLAVVRWAVANVAGVHRPCLARSTYRARCRRATAGGIPSASSTT